MRHGDPANEEIHCPIQSLFQKTHIHTFEQFSLIPSTLNCPGFVCVLACFASEE